MTEWAHTPEDRPRMGAAAADIHFDPETLRRYDVPGPRYTSYPTAVQFHESFDDVAYRRSVIRTAEEAANPLSLYVHIPFCASPCFYCGCNRVILRHPERAEPYLSRLFREIVWQAALVTRRRTVEQLHFGGGTPTFLTPAQMACLMNRLDRYFRLDRSDKREFSIEVDPRTVDEVALVRLADLGFNRVSLGVQDLDPEVQRAVNRVQDPEATLALISQARARGFRSVNVDLIYGLPLQTPARFEHTLDRVIEARPDRIALYSYAHLPERFKPQQRIRAEDLPTPEVKLELLRVAIERLGAAGYRYIGMDHFALPDDDLARAQQAGELHRNFQGYTTRGDLDLVGLGVSAIGRVGNAYAQNARTLPEYYGRIDRGRLPVVKGWTMNADDRIRHDAIQALMCRDGLDFDVLEQHHGITVERYFAAELAALRPLADDGLIRLDPRRVTLLPGGGCCGGPWRRRSTPTAAGPKPRSAFPGSSEGVGQTSSPVNTSISTSCSSPLRS